MKELTVTPKKNQNFVIMFFVVITSFLLVFSYLVLGNSDNLAAKTLVFFNISVVLLTLLHDINTKKFDIFDAKYIFILYFGLQFILWPIIVLWLGITRRPIEVDGYYSLGLFYSLLGLMFFLLGNSFGRRIFVSSRIYLPSDKWDSKIIWLLFGLFILIGYSAFAKLMSIAGGIDNYIALSAYYRSGGLVGLGYLVFLCSTVLSYPLLLFVAEYFNASRVVKPIYFFILAAMVCLCLFPATVIGFRTAILFPLLQMLVILNYSYKKMSVYGLVINFFGIFGILLTLGRWRQQLDEPAESSLLILGLEILDTASRFNASEVTAIIIQKLEGTQEFILGIPSLLGFAGILIPRAIFPNKMKSVSEYFSEEIMAEWFPAGVEPSGVAPSIIGELYWNFSFVGVVLFMAFFGFICAVVYKFAITHQGNRTVLVGYSVFYTFVFFASEAPTVAINGFIPTVVALTGILILVNKGKILTKV